MNYKDAIKRLEQTRDGLHKATSLFPDGLRQVYGQVIAVDDEAFRLAIDAMRICDTAGDSDHPFDYNDVCSTIRWMRESMSGDSVTGKVIPKAPEKHDCYTALSFALVALERQESVRHLITRWNYRARDHGSGLTSGDVAKMEQQAALMNHIKELGDAWNCIGREKP